jgi:AmpD protein
MRTDACWDAGGWYRGARRIDSPNFGLRPADAVIDLVVLHCISLPPARYGGSEILQFFTNTLDWDAHPYFKTIRGMQVSAHFLVRRDGELCQFVGCDHRAWHAGVSSYRGRSNCNDDSIGIELEGVEDGPFAAVQYESLRALIKGLAARYPVAHVAGHEHVAPGRKSDPGPCFDWFALQRQLGWPDQYFPELS